MAMDPECIQQASTMSTREPGWLAGWLAGWLHIHRAEWQANEYLSGDANTFYHTNVLPLGNTSHGMFITCSNTQWHLYCRDVTSMALRAMCTVCTGGQQGPKRNKVAAHMKG